MCSNHAKIDLGFTREGYPAGTHMCLIYSSEEERRKVISRYLESGLKAGEKVGYFTDSTSSEEVFGWLEEMGVKVSPVGENDQFNVASTRDVYFPKGEFVPEETFEMLKSYYTSARESHFPAVRVSGEMSWVLKKVPGVERLMEYECEANEVSLQYPVTSICQYDANKFDGATILECLKVHPYIIVKGQVVKNPYYLSTEDYLKVKTF